MSILLPEIDPVAFSIIGIRVHWYGIAYLVGIILGIYFISILNKKDKVFSSKAFDDLVLYIVFGIVIGGRLGYVLFYHTNWIWKSPMDLFKIWQGGMSFHGGLVGVIISISILCRRYKINLLKSFDQIACVAPIGLFFGRIANFINAELYGRVTNVSWGVIFPNSYLPRHPTQLYEATLEGGVLFIITMMLYCKTNISKNKPGFISGIFLSIYSIVRIVIEYYREPDSHLGFIIQQITMGQILSIPVLLLGIYLILRK